MKKIINGETVEIHDNDTKGSTVTFKQISFSGYSATGGSYTLTTTENLNTYDILICPLQYSTQSNMADSIIFLPKFGIKNIMHIFTAASGRVSQRQIYINGNTQIVVGAAASLHGTTLEEGVRLVYGIKFS